MNKKLCILFLTSAILFACQKESRKTELLVLSTDDVEIDGSTVNGLTFSASVILDSEEAVIENGFVYSLQAQPSLEDGEVLKVDEIKKSSFTSKLTNTLVPDTTYYLRSYLKTAKYLIYGNEVSFFSNGSKAPNIKSIKPETAIWGDTIMITGENFDQTGKNNTVWFNELEANQKWGTKDTIYVVVPKELSNKKSNVYISLYGKKSVNNKIFEIHSPVIHSISRTEGQYPDTVIVQGDYLSDHGSLLFGENKPQTISISKSEIRFIVPFLGEKQTIPVLIQQLNENIQIENNFKYLEQKITGLSTDSIFIGDTITIYAQNIDLLKVDLKTKIDNEECDKGLLWKDSMKIITKDLHLFSSEFSVVCSLNDQYYSESKIVYQSVIGHKNPIITNIETPQMAYLGDLVIDVDGLYGYSDIDVILFNEKNEQFTIESYMFTSFVKYLGNNKYSIELSKDIVPDNYKLKIQLSSRLSNSATIEVMIPEINHFGENINYKRGDEIFIEGEYLPNNKYAYQLKQIPNGRVFRRSNYTDSEVEDISYYPTNKLIGRGEYQLEFVFDDEIYKTGYSVFLDDYFDFITEYEWNPDYNFFARNLKSNVCFAKDGKLYSMLYDKERIEILDLKTRSFIRKYTNLNINDLLIYPTIVHGNIYVSNNRKLYKFNFVTDKWISQDVDHSNDTIINTCVINDELVVQNSSNDILRYNGSWEDLGKGDLANFAYGTGNFCYTYFEGEVQKKSLDDFGIFSQTPSPLKPLINKNRTQIFVYNSEIFETDIYYSTLRIAKFSPKDNSFKRLNPEFITDFGATIARIFSDINGEVYYETDKKYIYKFNP